MSTNHTPNYALSLWEASDQVQRTEFNENHAKIDTALAGLQAGQLRIHTGKYRGDGTDRVVFDLPFHPVFLYIQKMVVTDERLVMMGENDAITFWSGTNVFSVNTGNNHVLTINDCTVDLYIFATVNGEKRMLMNQKNSDYMYVAIG